MQEFVTAAREDFAPEVADAITFRHDDREVTFYRPTSAQLSIIAATANADDFQAAGTYLSMFLNMADEDSRRYFYARLMDRNDPFDVEGEGGVQSIMEWLLEEWFARPTKQPSDYRRPSSPTGSRSTATTRAKGSTSSASRRAASSTS